LKISDEKTNRRTLSFIPFLCSNFLIRQIRLRGILLSFFGYFKFRVSRQGRYIRREEEEEEKEEGCVIKISNDCAMTTL